MALIVVLLLLINTNSIVSIEPLSFSLTLNIDGVDNYFPFVETTKPESEYILPTVIMLDDEYNPTLLDSSNLDSFQSYHVQSDDNIYGFATVVHDSSNDNDVLFATVQISNGSFYDISSTMSITETKMKRSLNSPYIVRSQESIIEEAYVNIEWNNKRQRREYDEELSTMTSSVTEETTVLTTEQLTSISPTMEDVTIVVPENDTEFYINTTMAITTTTPRSIPEKTRHLSLEIVALVDSLITNDLRATINKTELETIEILKLYYIHVFICVEQLYRQSLIYETLDVHIRLTKIIFATDKHRLPWESFKNISSLTENYRKSPNNVHLRPNVSMDLLKSLHQAYKTNKFDERYLNSGADHIVTFTRLDLINGAGSAYVLGTCLPLFKYSIVQDDLNSFSVTLTVTHELGHNLGLTHDEIENTCFDPQFRYIMSPKNMNTVDRQQLPYFSECSIKELNYFVDNTTTTCWKNKIISTKNDTKFEKLRNITSMYLGQIINLHQQCQLQYGPRSVPFISMSYNTTNHTLYEENICNQLRCFKTLEDEYMYWQDGAFDGTPCGENRVCHKKECILTNQTMIKSDVDNCPYGDLSVPIPMLNLMDRFTPGNMHCADALNLLRSRGMNVTYLCYDTSLPYYRLCCEECKKHLIPECGDTNTRCSMFSQYCDNEYVRINGMSPKKLCPYTCGQCPNLVLPPTTTTTTTTTQKPSTKKSKTAKPRKYVKPKTFDKYTCIDSTDCAQLVKVYSKLNKKVKNWCTEYSTMIDGYYFVELCPKYCSICNVTSECDQYKLCRNNGTCIKDKNGTYQCLCSKSKFYYGTLCEYRQTCLDNPCSSKTEYCIQAQGENYVCLSKEDKEQLRMILK